MKAMGFNEHGNYEKIHEIEVKDPNVPENYVLIRLKSTSINTLDLMTRNGIPGFKFEMPHIPGSDVFGIVEAVGKNANKFSIGDEVIANTAYGCGICSFCKSGLEHKCPSLKCLGLHVNGSYAELISVPESILLRASKSFTEKELAALPLHLPLAWRNIKKLALAKPDETILIKGATGNVGIYGILMAKALKLNIIALTRNPENELILKKLGVNTVISGKDYTENLTKSVMDITNNKGVDIILESFGSTMNTSIDVAAYNARIISFGVLTGSESNINIRKLYLRNISILGTHNASKEDLDESIEFAIKNNIHPLISASYDLKDASVAQKKFEDHNSIGKIILQNRF
ncbi:MAG: alcohol dehydrogenase catalytic domain-containing protein [Candidatus Micrarchaeia archaeon]